MRRLLEEAARTLGGSAALRRVGASLTVAVPDFATMLQSLGSPALLLQTIAELAAHFSPILQMSATELSAAEWICEQRLEPGYAPFREYCDFTCGLLGVVPHMFGLGMGDVVEEACAIDGAPACRFRVRWDDSKDQSRLAEHYQLRAELLEARLESL